MKTRRDFLLMIPAFFIACTSKKNQPSEEEIKKLQEQAGNYHQTIDKKLLSEGHPIAATFKYVKDATTASAQIRKMRMGINGNDQFCHNCQYYAAIGEDYGSCQLLPQGNVTANGWCFSWTKKMASAEEVEKQYQTQ